MKIDMHIHIHRTSRCARQEPPDVAKRAIEQGIEGIVLLDHHYYATDEDVALCHQTSSSIRVFKGVELTVKSDKTRGSNDIVIVCPSEPKCYYGKYHEPINEDQLHAVLEYIHANDGFAILAHPFRKNHPIAIDLDINKIDCVEIASKNTSPQNRKQIFDLSSKYKMAVVSTSDAHKTKHIGNYCIETNDVINSYKELKDAILSRKFVPMETRLCPITE